MSKRCVGMLGWMLMPMASLAAQVGNPSGTGPLPAVAQSLETLPGHTLFAPVKLPKDPLPLLVWGNGACRDNGLQHGAFLRQIASNGYIVIALGRPREERPFGDLGIEACTIVGDITHELLLKRWTPRTAAEAIVQRLGKLADSRGD